MISYLVLLTLAFISPLLRLMKHASGSDLHSHILLVPAISAYLLHDARGRLPAVTNAWPAGTCAFGGFGISAVVAALLWQPRPGTNDYLALMATGYVCLLSAGACWLKGREWVYSAAFPLAFLIFLVPLPDAVVYWLERGSVVASAEAAALYFWIADIPLVRHGTLFELPGITLRVAQECSGIRSSWVLFITSILAANIFLKKGWRRLLLVAFVIPLGILRNGFRVFVLGMLSIHVGPHIFDSPIHHRGGPLFFGLSLGPLFGLVWWLWRGERRNRARAASAHRESAA